MRSKRSASPPWITTFADLMALLTTFFVLLLSLSQIDSQRYKQIAGSLERAFGDKWVESVAAGKEIIGQEQVAPVLVPAVELELREKLATAIADGLIEVGMHQGEMIISFQYEAAFESGSEVLMPHFRPIISRIARALGATTEGIIHVSGHTDDVPINTPRFRSNWDLSTARAVSVVHQLLEEGALEPKRLIAEGFADTRPVSANGSSADRARNRRVEIRVNQG